MKEESRAWIEAGIVLGKNPLAHVACPTCGDPRIEVEGVPHPKSPGLVDRYLRCSKCGAYVVLTRLKMPREQSR